MLIAFQTLISRKVLFKIFQLTVTFSFVESHKKTILVTTWFTANLVHIVNYGWADVNACEEIKNTFYGTGQIYPREDKIKKGL